MSVTDDYLANNTRYAQGFSGPLPMPPANHIAVVACMDARLNVYGMLGLNEGEAHVIRNAGGVVTDDVIRSLAISQRLLGTREIMLIHHTDCGMLTFTDDAFKLSVQDETGIKPPWAAEAFTDPGGDVRQSIARIKASPPAETPGSATGPAPAASRTSAASSTQSASRRRRRGSVRPIPGRSGATRRNPSSRAAWVNKCADSRESASPWQNRTGAAPCSPATSTAITLLSPRLTFILHDRAYRPAGANPPAPATEAHLPRQHAHVAEDPQARHSTAAVGSRSLSPTLITEHDLPSEPRSRCGAAPCQFGALLR